MASWSGSTGGAVVEVALVELFGAATMNSFEQTWPATSCGDRRHVVLRPLVCYTARCGHSAAAAYVSERRLEPYEVLAFSFVPAYRWRIASSPCSRAVCAAAIIWSRTA